MSADIVANFTSLESEEPEVKLSDIFILRLDEDGFQVNGPEEKNPLCKGWLEDAQGNFDENNIAGLWVVFNTQLRAFADGITWAWLPDENKTLVKVGAKEMAEGITTL